jgi:hypothetical protein
VLKLRTDRICLPPSEPREFFGSIRKSISFFGGTPEKTIFDNAKIAVKDGFGAHAKKQAGYTALSAHYGFDALFCNPGEGHEKGLVEGLVGWARRNILVPVPKVDSLQELNLLLEQRCTEYIKHHHIKGKPASVNEMFEKERSFLRALPGYDFETAKCSSVRISSSATARFDTNDYSVPVSYCGNNVSVAPSLTTGWNTTTMIVTSGIWRVSHQMSTRGT